MKRVSQLLSLALVLLCTSGAVRTQKGRAQLLAGAETVDEDMTQTTNFSKKEVGENAGPDGGQKVEKATYSLGTCMPSGSYEFSECCPAGYEQITGLVSCKRAFDVLALPNTKWGGNAPRNRRPSGCFRYTGNMNVHFNPDSVVGNGQTLFGDDEVICTKKPEGYSYTSCVANSGNCNLGGEVGSTTWLECSSSNRCHQASLNAAVAICNAHSSCTGITRDNAGYEPRTGSTPSQHSAAHELWLKA